MHHQRDMLSRAETLTGLGASVVGILGCVYAVFGPTYRYAGGAISTGGRAVTVSGSITAAQRGLAPTTLVFLAVVLLVLISFGVVSYRHNRRRSRSALTLLWMLVAVLWISVVVGAASIGLFLVPATLLAVVTAVLASQRCDRPGAPPHAV